MLIHTYEEDRKHPVGGFNETWWVAAFKMPRYGSQVDEMRAWCYKTFGQSGYHPLTDEFRWRDDIPYGEVRFSRKQDLEWFVIKWS